MAARFDRTVGVKLELPSVLKPIQIAIPVGRLDADPGVRVWIRRAPAACNIDVAMVSGQLNKRLDSGTREVSGGEIDSVVAFAHVECSAIFELRRCPGISTDS